MMGDMLRTTTLAALAFVLLAPALAARADMAPSPPPEIEVSGRPTVHTARSGGPTSATWVVRNTGAAVMHVRIGRAIHLAQGMRLPLQIVGVRVDGRETRELDLAPGASATIEVALGGFTDLAARLHEWTIELGLEVRGDPFHSGNAQGTTTVRRIMLPG